MVRITPAEMKGDFDRYRDLAQSEPVSVTEDGQDGFVILSVEEYARLKSYDQRVVLYPWELSGDDLAALEAVEIPEESVQFDHEYTSS